MSSALNRDKYLKTRRRLFAIQVQRDIRQLSAIPRHVRVVPGPSTRDRRFACVMAVRTFHLNATRCRRFGTISQSLRYDQLFLHFIHHSVAFRAEFKRHRQNPPAQTLERAGKGPHLRNYDCTSVLLIWNSYLSSRTWRRYMAYDNSVAKRYAPNTESQTALRASQLCSWAETPCSLSSGPNATLLPP